MSISDRIHVVEGPLLTSEEKRVIDNKSVLIKSVAGSYNVFIDAILFDREFFSVDIENGSANDVQIRFSTFNNMGVHVGKIRRTILEKGEKFDIVRIRGYHTNLVERRREFDFKAKVPHSKRCTVCKVVFEIACAVGCGVGLFVLCFLAGAGSFGIAGGICAAIGATVCWYIGKHGCKEKTAEQACKEMGMCNDKK